MTEVWYCNSSGITKAQFDNYLIHLSPVMQQEVLRYRFFNDQLVRLIARLMIYKATGYNKELFYSWQRFSNNKPFIPQWKTFNISHSGDYVAVSIGETMPLGIDIEAIRIDTDVISLAQYFCPAEKDELLQAENPSNLFFNLWTKKESLLKALGDGLVKEGLGKFDCRYNSVKVGNKTTWYFNEIKINAHYSCHLATMLKDEQIVAKELQPHLLLNKQ